MDDPKNVTFMHVPVLQVASFSTELQDTGAHQQQMRTSSNSSAWVASMCVDASVQQQLDMQGNRILSSASVGEAALRRGGMDRTLGRPMANTGYATHVWRQTSPESSSSSSSRRQPGASVGVETSAQQQVDMQGNRIWSNASVGEAVVRHDGMNGNLGISVANLGHATHVWRQISPERSSSSSSRRPLGASVGIEASTQQVIMQGNRIWSNASVDEAVLRHDGVNGNLGGSMANTGYATHVWRQISPESKDSSSSGRTLGASVGVEASAQQQVDMQDNRFSSGAFVDRYANRVWTQMSPESESSSSSSRALQILLDSRLNQSDARNERDSMESCNEVPFQRGSLGSESSASSSRAFQIRLNSLLHQSDTSNERDFQEPCSPAFDTLSAHSQKTEFALSGCPGRGKREVPNYARQADREEHSASDAALRLGASAVTKVPSYLALEELRALKAFGQADADAYYRALEVCLANKDVQTAERLHEEMTGLGIKSLDSTQLTMLRGGLALQPWMNDERSLEGWGDTPEPSPRNKPSRQLMQPRMAFGEAGKLLRLPHQAIEMQPHFGTSIAIASPTAEPGCSSRSGEQVSGAISSHHEPTRSDLRRPCGECSSNHEQTHPLFPPGHFAASAPAQSEDPLKGLKREDGSDLEHIATERQQQVTLNQDNARHLIQRGPCSESAVKGKVLATRPQLTSVRLMHHDSGTCKPCAYRNHCKQGVNCLFCHHPDHDEYIHKKRKPCKGQRKRYRKLISFIHAEILNDPIAFDIESRSLPPSLMSDEEARSKFIQKMKQFQQHVIARVQTGDDNSKYLPILENETECNTPDSLPSD